MWLIDQGWVKLVAKKISLQIILVKGQSRNRCWIVSFPLQQIHFWLPFQFFLARLSLVRTTPLCRNQRKILIFRGTFIFQILANSDLATPSFAKRTMQNGWRCSNKRDIITRQHTLNIITAPAGARDISWKASMACFRTRAPSWTLSRGYGASNARCKLMHACSRPIVELHKAYIFAHTYECWFLEQRC